MSGTPIDKLRYMQNMGMSGFQSGDEFGNDVMTNPLSRNATEPIEDFIEDPPKKHSKKYKKTANKVKALSEEVGETEKKFVQNIPKIFREPLIISILYIILSLDIVKKTLGTYIPQINSGADGNIAFTGIVVYAIILSIGYLVLKKVLL